MPRGISRLLRDRQGSAPALMVFLLAVAGLAGDSAVVSTLRGYAAENETHPAADIGVLRSPHQLRRRGKSRMMSRIRRRAGYPSVAK